MGNVSGRGAGEEESELEDGSNNGHHRVDAAGDGGGVSTESMVTSNDQNNDNISSTNNNNNNGSIFYGNSESNNNYMMVPPQLPARSTSPLLFPPQVPVAPLQMFNGPTFLNTMWQNESQGEIDVTPEQGVPTIITWNYGGSNVAVEGSWDNWTSRKQLQRSGKDHSVLLVLSSGIYHYRFLVDGECRYDADRPFVADETGRVCNVLDVNDYVLENPESVTEFEAPPSPHSTYSQTFPTEDDFAKEPLAVPPQLHLTVLDMENPDGGASTSKPQHVVLNHLFIEKGWASQSLVALGMTHRFESKYVTVVLYKPVKR